MLSLDAVCTRVVTWWRCTHKHDQCRLAIGSVAAPARRKSAVAALEICSRPSSAPASLVLFVVQHSVIDSVIDSAIAHHAARNRKTVRARQTPRRIRGARLAVRLYLARAPTHLCLFLGTMEQRRGQVGIDTAARVASIGRAQHGPLTSRQRHRLGRTPAPVLSAGSPSGG